VIHALCSAHAALRLARARAWLRHKGGAGADELLVVASPDAARDLLREAAVERGAAFGWHRASLARIAASLAAPALCERALVPVGALAAEAVATRVVHELGPGNGLGRYARVGDGPGLPRALARTLDELRLAGIDPPALDRVAPELVDLLRAYEEALARAGLADRARVLALAVDAARDAASTHSLLGLPTLLLDVAIEHAAERDLVAALLARAPAGLVCVPAGDGRALEHLHAIGLEPETPVPECADALGSLQAGLFEKGAVAPRAAGPELEILSAPGESRECVEIARHLLRHARDGVPFDRMAILLRSPEEYRPHLEDALGRAGVPAHFAGGVVRPDPTGRAFLALLACAAEDLSARRFAEYLSLGELPDATDSGAPPASPPSEMRWVAPDAELVSEAVAEALALDAPAGDDTRVALDLQELAGDPDGVAVTSGRLRAPRRWEELLVEAAVIGGRERWQRRLGGLRRAREQALALSSDPDEASALRLQRELGELEALQGFALPLLAALEALPREAAWGVWLDRLGALAARALRRPQRVHAVLGELAPMAEVGPVGLAEVRLVLARRLLELPLPPGRSRYGRVFVAPCEAARGLAFDVVCVPGLAEKLFPKPIGEDPILLDRQRRALAAGLATNEERVARERLALRVAVGAARARLLLSWPRIDLEKSRPRVASFYALEALRAGEGMLPGFDALEERAERATQARIGWPAPERPEDAVDEAEHDLALLRRVFDGDPAHNVGTARYLLDANPYLGRALRFRARRWLRRWTGADGLVRPGQDARESIAPAAVAAIAAHALSERSYSPTALQGFAACPYRFLLQAVHRLSPREVPEAIDEMDALQRGSLVHDVQFELFGALERAKLLPVRPGNLARARELLDETLDAVAARHCEELAPAIERVWADGVAGARADLREWLRRASEDESGFVPWRFELAFGLPERRARDPHSTPDPVALDCGIRLRGSIDLVERRADGALRATDHKTGRERMGQGEVLAGGHSLQPVLYALALEKLFPEAGVESGRLYYCTAAGGYREATVALGEKARAGAARVARAIGAALAVPFLPAAPAEGACRSCDYAEVCGPYEEIRTRRKSQEELAELARLREMP
jgi:CRISPR/Cas system-associated exonuclease Cas4 (RecB family)